MNQLKLWVLLIASLWHDAVVIYRELMGRPSRTWFADRPDWYVGLVAVYYTKLSLYAWRRLAVTEVEFRRAIGVSK